MLRKRIPTIFGIFLLLIGITVGVYLVQMGAQPLSSNANPNQAPKDVRITNIKDNSFTVSWRTEAEIIGFIRYGKKETDLKLSSLDDRNKQQASESNYKNHYVTVSGLTPETIYYFEIISGNDSVPFNNGGQPYSISTAPFLQQTNTADTAYGVILNPDLSPAESSIIYVTMTGGAPLSSLSGSNGSWAVSLSSLHKFDLNSFLEYDREKGQLAIEVLGNEGSVATAIVSTADDSPVGDIVLGHVHDFTAQIDEKTSTSSATSQFSLDPLGDITQKQLDISINNPTEGEILNTSNPEFLGEGLPGTKIDILLESNQTVNQTVIVNGDGNWSWTPPENLEPGEHTITLNWIDSEGIIQTLVRNFVVYAQGSSNLPAFEATPSAVTPTPTPTPTLTPTPTPTPTPTSVTIIPTPAATEPALPTPGGGALSILIIITGLIISLSGAIILLKKIY